MSDYMIRATAADNQIRAFAITSRELTEEARKRHNSSPIVTAALGRLMSGAVMMGSMMKGEKDLLTIQVKGDGPMRGLTVTADAKGNVKGYPYVPDVVLPANAMGKFRMRKGSVHTWGIENWLSDGFFAEKMVIFIEKQ